ncbi:MAG: hypothetical protein MZU95_06910 [Desulfomicrobium escambiense]|nr:hypothetical protein [Desulfomicrobium escambiense]
MDLLRHDRGFAVIVLRKKRPDLERPYKTWGYPVTPVLFVLAAVYVAVGSLLSSFRNAMFGLLIICLGIPAYLYWKGKLDVDGQRMKYFVLGPTYVVRLDAGERIVETLRALCERDAIGGGLLPRPGRRRRGRDRALRPARRTITAGSGSRGPTRSSPSTATSRPSTASPSSTPTSPSATTPSR